MKQWPKQGWLWMTFFAAGAGLSLAYGQEVPEAKPKLKPTSFSPVDQKEPFAVVVKRMKAAKPEVMKRQMDLLEQRYDLGVGTTKGATMSRGKPVQQGPRTRLPDGQSWETLAALSPAKIRDQELFPAGFFPLPHPNHPEGGMLFPKFHIDEIKKQEGRD
ncbi:MAG: cytochrome B6, partial [Planctomycetaceae bacterium]|nr:cytochrome B6 [Planctomycetaceae bacterium]